MASDLDDFARLVPVDHGLCVVSVRRPGGSIHSSVVNAGVLAHPVTGARVVGLVAAGPAKLRYLRASPASTIVIRAGWQWVAVEGEADLIGPDDPEPRLSDDARRLLLRDFFTAAGGSHDDWDAYDRTMAEERRTAVLVTPTRIYSNPS
jgi:PPOX class probable F420-dependent enzyme